MASMDFPPGHRAGRRPWVVAGSCATSNPVVLAGDRHATAAQFQVTAGRPGLAVLHHDVHPPPTPPPCAVTPSTTTSSELTPGKQSRH
ncbi:hypothetical protein AB0M36_07300 [Actinoplanes sp. NPDC051346]|uniref:hypothetical protein n=1 Tax=Actinoplanes sp. NPDC051346 TaxID=3155048 RepID=UPI00341AF4D2